MLSKRSVWICVTLGVLAVLVIGGFDVVQWGAGLVDWLLYAPGAIWVGVAVVGMIAVGLGEITNE